MALKTTYNDILNSMKTAFFEKTGENVDLMSDLGARMQTVASELFSVSCYGDFVLKQAFPQTATGEYLDYHAQLRNMARKTASNATGDLTFTISQALDNDIVIPKGTICSMQDNPYIQFQTESKATIVAGNLSVTVGAVATNSGYDYNAAAGTVTVMVEPPSGVEAVTNENDFLGGCDDESDTALRKRIVASYSVPSTGVSAESIRESVLKLDNILDCLILSSDDNILPVYVRTRNSKLDNDLTAQITNSLMIATITACEINVKLAQPITFNLNIDVELTNGESESVKSKIEEVVNEYAGALRIGESLNLNKIAHLVAAVDGISFSEVSSNDAVGNSVYCSNDSYLKLNTVEVNCYE